MIVAHIRNDANSENLMRLTRRLLKIRPCAIIKQKEGGENYVKFS